MKSTSSSRRVENPVRYLLMAYIPLVVISAAMVLPAMCVYKACSDLTWLKQIVEELPQLQQLTPATNWLLTDTLVNIAFLCSLLVHLALYVLYLVILSSTGRYIFLNRKYRAGLRNATILITCAKFCTFALGVYVDADAHLPFLWSQQTALLIWFVSATLVVIPEYTQRGEGQTCTFENLIEKME